MSWNDDAKNQFIVMVQTALLIRYAADPGDGSDPLSRPCWAVEHLEHAYELASKIPGDVTPRQAADAFLTWLIARDKLTDEDKDILQILL